ncbi:MAG: M20/M25/M40 family metallo-hydrolase [Thermoleophilaceae bacterium]|nr:M20/M25/M40 family metallo-hydrolase [Thermoleophilaceae bacterium]
MDERALTERLITYDTDSLEGMQSAAAFVKGWLEARDVDVTGETYNGRPVLTATVGAQKGPTVVLHAHLDVVPALPEQFEPRLDGDRLYGRGAYDMKGGLAAMMCAVSDLAAQDLVRVHFVCVSDEESDEQTKRGTDYVVQQGFTGDFAITGEPTNLHIGIQAKGVLVVRVHVSGRSAHGSTPWLGDNAVLKAIDVFRGIESLPFTRETSDLFDRPSISLGRIVGGDAVNRVPDTCAIDLDIRYLPGQDADEILADIGAQQDSEVTKVFHREPIVVARDEPYVQILAEAVCGVTPLRESIAVGRDGTSDVISFLNAGMPGVEFGPSGDGHHGPEEWVSIESLAQYRRALVEFVNLIPQRLRKPALKIA